MVLIAEIVFWSCFALIAYTFVLFPFILWLKAKCLRRPTASADQVPRVTLVVAAHNEADVMRRRIENILALDYPTDRMQVIIVSDGSDDGTNEIVAEYTTHGIRLLALPRVGKVAALNQAMVHATGEVVVFSDANTMCDRDSLRTLIRPFSDPSVGGVAGNQQYLEADKRNASAHGECSYWNFDQLLKTWESEAGSVTNSTGALHAIRRSLFRPLPTTQSVSDDAVISFRVVAAGYRVVYAHDAVAREPVTPCPRDEFQRKVRVIVIGMRSVLAVRELLNPARYGFFSLQLFSHKVLRWLIVWPLICVFASSFVLAAQSKWIGLFLLLQMSFYLAALAVWISDSVFRNSGALSKSLTLPYFFCLTYAASIRAQWFVLTGRSLNRWTVVRGGVKTDRARPKPRRVAYIMSRFPKVTETFVMYEMLEMERQGQPVEIYPLIRQKEHVTHPDAAAMVERAHYKPFLSFKIIRDNFRVLRRDPSRYLRTLTETLRGTIGSANFFAGAMAFFPKSVAFAEEMKQEGVTHIHAHFATHPALSAFVIHRLTGIPYSFTAHGHDIHCDATMLARKLSAASFAIAVSNYNRKLMGDLCGAQYLEKIHVLHCGADTSFFRPRRQFNSLLRIITVGSLGEVKGHRYLIEACALLRDRGIAFRCDFVGDGELRNDLVRQVAQLGLQQAFTFHGALPRNVVRDLLCRSDVKVLSSVPTSNGLREGIPVALMEGMACGLPVVSSQISGIPELVDNGISGILVPPRDVAGLADALEQLATNPAMRARMGAARRERIVREFDLESNVRRLASLISKDAQPAKPEERIAA